MTAPTPMSNEDLRQAQMLGLATLTTAYLRLMAGELGVEIEDDSEIRNAVPVWRVPVNLAMTIGWAIWMHDKGFALKSVEELRKHIEETIE